MVVAILNPGPSLANLLTLPKCDLSIAVNRAALRFECNIWAATDYPMIRDYQVFAMGNPKLLTRRQTWTDIKHRVRLPLAGIVDDLALNVPANWLAKTMTCAMAYAYAWGAHRIELYGCDWAGTKDFDGKEAGENRTDARWEAEKSEAGMLIEWLASRKVEVKRN